ncbi:hypothetical protein AB0J20_26575 [Micromonospora costi]|uniref:hypothetical protein n=1 Tax=Micromonospora costi TaxID=1530042 RepID=UPI0033D5E1E0
MNWIEAEFAAVRYFALNGTDHRTHAEQDAALGDYIRWRNQRARPKTGFATGSKIAYVAGTPGRRGWQRSTRGPRGACAGKSVQDQAQALVGPAAPQDLEEGQELAPSFAVADAVVQPAGGQVEGGDHVSDASVAV